MMFGDINTEAPLWLLLPKAFVSILVSALLILLIFWLQFGDLPLVAFGFATFISVLQILMIVGLRFQNRTEMHSEKRAQKDWIDKLGAWWLMACAFGAFFGWICNNGAESFPSVRLAFYFGAIFFTIILPIVTMLPNLRYVSGKSMPIQIPLLIFVTVLPILVGIHSLLRIWRYLSP